jgi:hypothetical protein
MSAMPFEVRPIPRTESYEIWVQGEEIGKVTHDDLGWTANCDDQSQTCLSLEDALAFIQTVWEPGIAA